MENRRKSSNSYFSRIDSPKPILNIRKIGMVSRNYEVRFTNGYRDFSQSLGPIVEFLDGKGCDAALYSLYSIIPRKGYDPKKSFDGLKNIRAVFLEEFKDGAKRRNERYIVYYRAPSGWLEYDFCQQFSKASGISIIEMHEFVKKELPGRILGNSCVLLCGETNGVKYSPADKKVHDAFGLRRAIPKSVKIILNPIHDRMTRHEMKRKRRYLSEGNRWVISVWNKGKKDRSGKTRDGKGPAWTIFHDRKEKEINVQEKYGVEVGIVDIRRPPTRWPSARAVRTTSSSSA